MPEKKSKKNQLLKFFIAAMGPGEATQGIGLANYFLKRKLKIIFGIRLKQNLNFLRNQKNKFRFFLIDTPAKLKKIFEKEKPDVIVYCNSKIASYYQPLLKTPPIKLISVSLDSNWLFSKKGDWYSFLKWLDRYFILFPKKIFQFGLRKYGGNYTIPSSVMKRIKVVGFIPSYQKPGLKERLKIRKKFENEKDEKLIFSYFGGFGAGFRFWALENLIKVVENLIREGLKIKIIYIGPLENLKPDILKKLKQKWFIHKRNLSKDDFFSILSSSDLVFQHQGIGTLVQAISCRIPVIANVRDLKDEPYKNHAHAWEVTPFAKLNLCKMLFRSSPLKEIREEMKKLLYDKKEIKKMRSAQKKYYKAGEPLVYKMIMKLVKTKTA